MPIRRTVAALVLAATAISTASALEDTTGFQDLRIGYEATTHQYHRSDSYNSGTGGGSTDKLWTESHRLRIDLVGGRERKGIDLAYGIGFAGERSQDTFNQQQITYSSWSVRLMGGPWTRLWDGAQLELMPLAGAGMATLKLPDSTGQTASTGTLIEAGVNLNLIQKCDDNVLIGISAGGLFSVSSHLVTNNATGTSLRSEIESKNATIAFLVGWRF